MKLSIYSKVILKGCIFILIFSNTFLLLGNQMISRETGEIKGIEAQKYPSSKKMYRGLRPHIMSHNNFHIRIDIVSCK